MRLVRHLDKAAKGELVTPLWATFSTATYYIDIQFADGSIGRYHINVLDANLK